MAATVYLLHQGSSTRGPGGVFHKMQCVMNIEAWVTRHYKLLWLKENKFTAHSKILNNYQKL